MARPLRIEFAGALYHVTSRGDRREPIFEDDEDPLKLLGVLAEVVNRLNWLCHAWCLMTNHYHLVVETPQARRCDRYRLWHRRVQLPRDRRILPIASCDRGPDYPSTDATMRELTPYYSSVGAPCLRSRHSAGARFEIVSVQAY